MVSTRNKLLSVILVLICLTVSIHAEQIPDKEYTIDCSLWHLFNMHESIVDENRYYYLVDPETCSLKVIENQSCILTVMDKEKQLSYDITSSVFADIYQVYDSYFVAKKNENGVFIVFNGGGNKVFLYTFDFKKMVVEEKCLGYVSFIFEDFLNEAPYKFKINYNFLINYFFNNSLPQDMEVKSFHKYNPFSGAEVAYLYPCVLLRNGNIYIDYKIKNDYCFQNIPEEKTLKNYYDRSIKFIENIKYQAKSYLIEKNREYKAQNMEKFNDYAWCPTLPYTEEEILIESEDSIIDALYIGNGYYRSDRKELYLQNSRAKEIEIECVESGMKQRVTLADTGFLQLVPLVNVNSHKLKIKILSVYEGEKYSDLCINCILPVRRWTFEENPDYRP
ncbi:hypothetical protein DYE49_11730 [Treponema rectale]|uniref:NAD glycohydrolase translocation F5/8 type C domain-containing protein n=1 Tax=Treponema rectale TaxID=744512 RepID=A0A840SE44_9SPIR|nr:hypothetical protein [Treponema rectale]MBB5219010.1 hypothetical protein [Treponema rectale]QOS41078.1 hypothetical protein DYE49_11730 [Treponema rectale]